MALPLNQLAITPDGKLIYGEACPSLTRRYVIPFTNYDWSLSVSGFRFGTYFQREDVDTPGFMGDFVYRGYDGDDLEHAVFDGSLSSGRISLPNSTALPCLTASSFSSGQPLDLESSYLVFSAVSATSRLWLTLSRDLVAWECDGDHPVYDGIDIFSRDPLSFIFLDQQKEIRRVLAYSISYHASGLSTPFYTQNGKPLYDNTFGPNYFYSNTTLVYHFTSVYNDVLKGFIYLLSGVSSRTYNPDILSEAEFHPYGDEKVFYVPISNFMHI